MSIINELMENINSVLESDKYKNYKFGCSIEIDPEEGIKITINSTFLTFFRACRTYAIGHTTECELEQILEWTLDDIIENDIAKNYGELWVNLLHDIDIEEVIEDIFDIDSGKELLSLFPKGSSDDTGHINIELFINDSSYMYLKILESDLYNVKSENELRNTIIKKYFETLNDIKKI